MSVKYCVDCDALERRPVMAETAMDSGNIFRRGYITAAQSVVLVSICLTRK